MAGDIGPTGEIFEPLGTLSFDDAVDIFAEQATALAGGGVDLFWVETLAAIEEGNAALAGIRRVAPDVPVIVTMTFDTHGRTMMGLTPEDACAGLTANGASAVGGNCGNGSAEVLAVVSRMHAVAPPGRRSSRRRTPACRRSPETARPTRARRPTRRSTPARRGMPVPA